MNVAASATGWGDLPGHVVPGRTVRAGAWHANVRGSVSAPPETQPVASQASTDDRAAGGLYKAAGMENVVGCNNSNELQSRAKQ